MNKNVQQHQEYDRKMEEIREKYLLEKVNNGKFEVELKFLK